MKKPENRTKSSRIRTGKPLAVALSYNETLDVSAPQVAAIGEYKLADSIKRVARRYGVPISVDRPVAEKLAALDLDQEIPRDLYLEVAQIFHHTKKSN